MFVEAVLMNFRRCGCNKMLKIRFYIVLNQNTISVHYSTDSAVFHFVIIRYLLFSLNSIYVVYLYELAYMMFLISNNETNYIYFDLICYFHVVFFSTI